MSIIAVVVSNPCVSDARVLKMIGAAKKSGHTVYVFATMGKNTLPYEVSDGVVFSRFNWSPAAILSDKLLFKIFKMLPGPIARVGRWLAKFYSDYSKYFLFADLFSKQIALVNPDIIHAHDLICLPAAERAAKDVGAKLVYDAHELEVHRNPPLPFLRKMWVSYIEKKYGKRADAVITVGSLIKDVLGHHLKRDDINVIYNSPLRSESIRNIRDDLLLSKDNKLMLYVGKITIGRGVGDILGLLPRLPGFFFAAVGPFDLKTVETLNRHAKRLGVLDRFRILPPVPHDQVVSYISGASIGMISVEPVTLSYRYCMPNKLFEFAFAGVPILSNDLDEIRAFLDELDVGEIADFEDKNILQNLICRMVQNGHDYVATDASAKLLESKYSWDSQAVKLNKIYSALQA